MAYGALSWAASIVQRLALWVAVSTLVHLFWPSAHLQGFVLQFLGWRMGL